MTAFDVDTLLAGPRGRRLCLALALGDGAPVAPPAAQELRTAVFYAAYDLDPGRGRSVVLFGGDTAARPRPTSADVARLLDVVPVPEPDDRTLLVALAESVDNARYWQEPDGEDVLAATPEVRAALVRVATVVAGSPGTTWWTAPLDPARQVSVLFPEGEPRDPGLTAAERLARWSAGVAVDEDEARRRRTRDPRREGSRAWWSSPPRDLPLTTRDRGDVGPLGLWAVEDGRGWETGETVRRIVPADARVLEIDGPQVWAELCRRYPLESSARHRGDWFRTTGRDGRWVVPDWSRVARDVDGVHVTVAGYLASAGRAIEVEHGIASVLAGWDPDATYWFRDLSVDAATSRSWRSDGHGATHWAPADP
jgi:hypothetical protein